MSDWVYGIGGTVLGVFFFWFTVCFGFFRMRAHLWPQWLKSLLRRSQAALTLYQEFRSQGLDVSSSNHNASSVIEYRAPIINGDRDGFNMAMLVMCTDRLEEDLIRIKERRDFKVGER